MKQPVNPKLLLTAMLFLAAITFTIGGFEISERQHLMKHGVEVAGVVVSIDAGLRGIRNVEARFVTLDDQVVVGRDIHKTQWSNANEIGDPIALRYDPQDPENILISRGLWVWSNPGFLLLGGLFLIGLGVFLYKQPNAKS